MNYAFDLDAEKRLIRITVESQDAVETPEIVLDIPFFIWKDVASSILTVEVAAEQLTRAQEQKIEAPPAPKIEIARV